MLGVYAYLGEEETRRRYQPLADYLDAQLEGVSVALEVLSLEGIEQGINDRTLDFITTSPTHFLRLRERYPLSGVIATRVRAASNGQPVQMLGGVILARIDRHQVQSIEDLKGKTIAAPSTVHLGGFRAPAAELHHAGINIHKDLGKLVLKNSHQDVVAAVLADEVDAGFVRTGILEELQASSPLTAMLLRVVNPQQRPDFPYQTSTRLYPEWPLFALPHVDGTHVRRFSAALFSLEPDHPAAQAAALHGFATPADYVEVERISRMLRLDPYDAQPTLNLADIWTQYRDGISLAFALALLLSLLVGVLLIFSNRNLRRQRTDLELQRAQLAEISAERSAVLGAIGEGVYGCDLHGRTTFINPAALKMLGFSEADVLHQKQHLLSHSRHADGQPYSEKECPIYLTGRDGKTRQCEDWFTRKDGSGFPVSLIATPLHRDGQRVGSVVVFCDITARKAAEQKMLKLSAAVEQNPASILITNANGQIEYVNQACVNKTGYSREELFGATPRIFQSGKTPATTYADLWSALSHGRVWRGELINRRKDGSEFTELATLAPVRAADGTVTHFLGIQQDISELKDAEEQIHRLANFDLLTGLPNRGLLIKRLQQLIHNSEQLSGSMILLIMNIDRFKTVNHARGQGCGDRLLGVIAERLRQGIRDIDTLARLGADEFALIGFSGQRQPEAASLNALRLAEQIHDLLQTPFAFEDQTMSVTTSIGVTLFPDTVHSGHPDTAQDAMRRAGTALQKAKQAGGNQTAMFDLDMGESALRSFQIEHDLRLGVMRNELRLFFQPKVSKQREVIGYEALVRWQHPTRGLTPPCVFIPIAEESDLICDIGAWVITEVCTLITQQQNRGKRLQVAVNISPRQFRTDDFVQWLQDVIAATGVDPELLTLEVTENLMIRDSEDVIIKMRALRNMGLRLSVDDFGTGYSSLAYLKRLPIQELKIDQSFIKDAPEDPDSAALVDTILAIARNLKLDVVAEGVETEAQAEFLRTRGAMLCQGYLFGRPSPAGDWLQ